jgi:hypothetical protein
VMNYIDVLLYKCTQVPMMADKNAVAWKHNEKCYHSYSFWYGWPSLLLLSEFVVMNVSNYGIGAFEALNIYFFLDVRKPCMPSY